MKESIATTTIRISVEAHRVLKSICARRGLSLIEAVDEMLEAWERQQFFDAFNQAYAAVREDPRAWKAEQEERSVWDTALMDNQEDERDG